MSRTLAGWVFVLAAPVVNAVAVNEPIERHVIAPVAIDKAASASYRFAWPVHVPGTDSLHRLTLPADLYPVLMRDDLSDIELVDDAGRAVPMAILAQESLQQWLELPTPMRIVRQHMGPLAEGAPYPSERSRNEILVESQQSRTLPILALRITYEHADRLPGEATFRARAHDRDQWVHVREVSDRFDVATRSGEVRIVLEPMSTRSVVVAVGPVSSALTIRSVMAEHAWREPEGVRWTSASPLAQTGEHQRQPGFEFASAGPAPWHRARISLGDDHVGTVRLFTRVHDGYWQELGTMTVYDISLDDARFARNALAFTEQRSRQFRVDVDPVPTHPPVLKLAYRPDLMVFSQRGPARLMLLAGSRQHRRADYPLDDMVNDVRRQVGNAWQPPEAEVGARVEWTGKVAFDPPKAAPEPKPEHRAWILWILLGLASIVVGGMALKLARDPQ